MGLFLIETDMSKKILDTDTLDDKILLRVVNEIKSELVEEFIRPIQDLDDNAWEMLDREGNRIEKVRESKEIAMSYFRDCHYPKIKPTEEEFLELIRKKGFYAKFLPVCERTIYL